MTSQPSQPILIHDVTGVSTHPLPADADDVGGGERDVEADAAPLQQTGAVVVHCAAVAGE